MTKGKEQIHKAYLNIITILINEPEIRSSFSLIIKPTDRLDNNHTTISAKFNGEEISFDDPFDPLVALNKFVNHITDIRFAEFVKELNDKKKEEEQANEEAEVVENVEDL